MAWFEVERQVAYRGLIEVADADLPDTAGAGWAEIVTPRAMAFPLWLFDADELAAPALWECYHHPGPSVSDLPVLAWPSLADTKAEGQPGHPEVAAHGSELTLLAQCARLGNADAAGAVAERLSERFTHVLMMRDQALAEVERLQVVAMAAADTFEKAGRPQTAAFIRARVHPCQHLHPDGRSAIRTALPEHGGAYTCDLCSHSYAHNPHADLRTTEDRR